MVTLLKKWKGDNLQRYRGGSGEPMAIHKDYKVRLNLNELIERRIPCCDLLHPDHCLSEKQVSEIAHDISMDLDLHPIYQQIDQHILRYVAAAGIENKDHWVEERLPDLKNESSS
tara:strand:- start:178 stop:522 length:345 start_codon:yes stop_codon:yes gene_type:complete